MISEGIAGLKFDGFQGFPGGPNPENPPSGSLRLHPMMTPLPVGGNVCVQGVSKQVTYEHSGCKMQAIKLSYCKIQH